MKNDAMVGKFPVHLLLNIATDGIEYSAQRGYWAQIETYKWQNWYGTDEDGSVEFDVINPDLTPDTILMSVRDDEDGEADNEEREFVPITLNDLAGATEWALAEYSHLFGYTVSGGKITDIDYDAIGADVIIQKIVLGEVVYG